MHGSRCSPSCCKFPLQTRIKFNLTIFFFFFSFSSIIKIHENVRVGVWMCILMWFRHFRYFLRVFFFVVVVRWLLGSLVGFTCVFHVQIGKDEPCSSISQSGRSVFKVDSSNQPLPYSTNAPSSHHRRRLRRHSSNLNQLACICERESLMEKKKKRELHFVLFNESYESISVLISSFSSPSSSIFFFLSWPKFCGKKSETVLGFFSCRKTRFTLCEDDWASDRAMQPAQYL